MGSPSLAQETVNVQLTSINSILQKNVTLFETPPTQNIISMDFQMSGVITISRRSLNNKVWVAVQPLQLYLTQGTDSLLVRISGSIGGVPASDNFVRINFSGTTATMNLQGDLDESYLEMTRASGNYTGTLTVTAVVL